MDKVKLFCIPYAGGNAAVYYKWKKYLTDDIELCPIELPGRGNRIEESLCDHIISIVEDVYESVIPFLNDKSEYSIFGHSMGSLIAYELYYKLIENGYKEPVHLFFSGGIAPQRRLRESTSYHLPLEQFKEEVLKYGMKTSSLMFENQDLINFFVPILRADFKIVETYEYISKKQKIGCNMTALFGKKKKKRSNNDI
ncbi:thioesterase [Bacillus aquiflavi]|uniref:thioesterase II family protein n=1 Tax=Bacillus aquiflavi TaxID=2672567 RepID=UPI001CAA26B4|nr:thioesterase domain-containing protein [Bacillus aquiflavi]UAC49541.1 thioesterase [Bacillus aquiflavi]